MKVMLVALNAKYVHSNLAVYDIYSYANKNEKYKDSLFVKEYTINNNLDYVMQMLYKENSDVIAFSSYIWNIREILLISKEITKINPNIKIWLGGPEVSYHSEELLREHSFISGIIIGEGEASFAELMEFYASEGEKNNDKFADKPETAGKSEIAEELVNADKTANINELTYTDKLSSINGIAYRKGDGTIIKTPPRPLISMDDVPFIYDNFDDFKNKIIYYETSRGCPFSCSYCLSSIDKTVRFRSLENVFAELQRFLDAKIPQVKFIDRTFNCNKNRALKIWEYLHENDNGITNFHFEISADLIDEEELDLFLKMRPGLIQLEIGLQSTNAATIHEIRRTMNIDKLKNNMLKVRDFNNIHQHLDLIAGLPFEDFETFKKSFNDAYAMKPHQLQLGFLKVLKGSHMEEMVDEYGLIYHDEQPYEVMSTKWISYAEIIKLKHVEEMVEVYHNSGQFDNVLPFLLEQFDTPFQFFYELGLFYETNHLFDIGFKREARYVALRDFAREKLDSLTVFDYLLSFDYYLRENAKSRPSWAKEEPIEKKMYQGFFINGGNEEFSLAQIYNDEDNALSLYENAKTYVNPTNYDSKTASRIMHIEPISFEAFLKLEKLGSKDRVITGSKLNEWIKMNRAIDVQEQATSEHQKDEFSSNLIYCLYDYEHRNPLSNEARVYFLSRLS